MARAFSVASWNVEDVGAEHPNTARRIGFLVEQEPDVFGLYELEGKEVWREIMAGLPGYSFFVAEGENTQEILVGIGPQLTGFVTQKTEFRSAVSAMRPGAFLIVHDEGVDYALLFLHVAGWPNAHGFGLRADMIDQAFEFKEYLDEIAADPPANFLFMGDLNTMGLDYATGREPPPNQKKRIPARLSAEQEIDFIRHLGDETGMRLLTKNADVTWGEETGMRVKPRPRRRLQPPLLSRVRWRRSGRPRLAEARDEGRSGEVDDRLLRPRSALLRAPEGRLTH